MQSDVENLIQKYREIPGGLVPLLQETQEEVGYLPREVLEKIASGLNLSLAKVVGVATFYHQFYLQPRGKNIIRVCMGTACHVRGASDILAAFEKELNIEVGETTLDQNFTLEEVACIGACSLAPVISINDNTHGKLVAGKIPELLGKYEKAVLH
ncbi:MAG: NADH-quinone oxidoreductase subunit NuoE [Clostridiales bacterium]|nr:NADH-quinone oxidoreductase subunit NuoE [Clostridiales bacterium]MCF8022213.1 NADH-quinone oxidoreductase subunit NuoE [Clostridiales bacterium]